MTPKWSLIVLASLVSSGADLPSAAERPTVRMLVVSDFDCPMCAQVAPIVEQARQHYGPGLQVLFKHFPLPQHPEARLAHLAAIAARRQAAFWKMHDRLFAAPKPRKREELLALAKELGLDAERFERDLTEPTVAAELERDIDEGLAIGIRATPTVFINGSALPGAPTWRQIQKTVDPLLGIPPSPERAREMDQTLLSSGGPVLGVAEAPVLLTVFSDFECPYCERAAGPIQQLQAKYPGQVKVLFKHFPLSFHRKAPLAHQASIAAAEQGKFWEYHDLLFANRKSLERADLLRHAGTLQLDLARFEKAMDAPETAERVKRDQALGPEFDVEGTPSFVMAGESFSGALSLTELEAKLRKALGQTGQPASPAPVSSVAPATQDSEVWRVLGPPHAPVEIQVFADASSRLGQETLERIDSLRAKYPQQVKFRFRHRPHDLRANALLAHKALAAAGRSGGKLWEFYRLLVQSPEAISKPELMALAQSLQLDLAAFDKGLDETASADSVEQDLAEAGRREIRGSPVFLIDGQRLDGVQPLSFFESFFAQKVAGNR